MKIENDRLLVKMVFGSHLYGTDTEHSDHDFKGVFLPSFQDVLLGKIPKSIMMNTKTANNEKNTSEDVDCELYSLHHFMKMVCCGETAAIDMLHCPDNLILHTTDIWEILRDNRKLFYTKNLKAFVGYARRQASKYGIKGSRLNDAKTMLDYLSNYIGQDFRMKDIWTHLPLGEHIHHEFCEASEKNNIKVINVCGRKIQDTVTVEYASNIVNLFYKNYGHRAKQAAENKGIDWKAVSHAIRAAIEIKSILKDGDLTFPLKDAEILKDIKNGRCGYLSQAAPLLEGLMDEVEELSAKSQLPEKVNRKMWDEFIVKIMKNHICTSSLA